MPKEIEVTVNPDGTTKTDFNGFAGLSCLDVARLLRELLAQYGIRSEEMLFTNWKRHWRMIRSRTVRSVRRGVNHQDHKFLINQITPKKKCGMWVELPEPPGRQQDTCESANVGGELPRASPIVSGARVMLCNWLVVDQRPASLPVW